MTEKCKDLPDECWEIIFKNLGHHSNFQALILVCKRFLSIITHIRTSLNLTIPAILIHGENLSHIFNQYPHIKSINLRQAGDSTPRLLDQIATSSLSVQSLDISEGSYLSLNRFQLLGRNMKSLRVLKCSKMLGFSDEKLAMIMNSVPWLEELDISFPQFLSEQNENVEGANVTDSGIMMLCSKMKGLRKIDISGNQFVTDKSLITLSSNCVLLEQVVAKNCAMITFVGIHFVVKNSANLAWLAVSQIDFRSPASNLLTRDCFSNARCLSTLDIDYAGVSDEFLYSLSLSGIPLKSFALIHCDGFGCDGIAVFLQRYPSLEYFYLTDMTFFPDETCVVEELIGYFSKLTTIKLKVCNFTELMLFMLVKSCPLLENIDMGNTFVGAGDDTNVVVSNPRIKTMHLSCNTYLSDECLDTYVVVSNPRIKTMHLSCNTYLSDECLAKLALVCPFLEILGVSYCSKITEKGISSFLNRCSNIRHLEIDGCDGIRNIGEGNVLPKLEFLSAKNSDLDNEGLAMIGQRCYELLNLNLEGCLRVTKEGLKKVLEDCRRLREINLSQCANLGLEIIDWMVFSRPSLRKIVPPSSSFPDVCQMQFYLHHGCYVWTPPADEEYDDKKYCFFFKMRLEE